MLTHIWLLKILFSGLLYLCISVCPKLVYVSVKRCSDFRSRFAISISRGLPQHFDQYIHGMLKYSMFLSSVCYLKTHSHHWFLYALQHRITVCWKYMKTLFAVIIYEAVHTNVLSEGSALYSDKSCFLHLFWVFGKNAHFIIVNGNTWKTRLKCTKNTISIAIRAVFNVTWYISQEEKAFKACVTCILPCITF